MKSVVVTGANGFVGSSLVKELIKNGYYVYAVVRYGKNNLDRISKSGRICFVQCELKNIASLTDKIKDEELEYFFHLAWEGTSGQDRGDYKLQLQNVKYTCDAVRTAKELKCRRFLFAGSIMEYEAKQYLGQNNARPGRGYIYSVAKLTADYMAKTEAYNCGLEYINCLISNIYGVGERSGRFINTTIRRMINQEELLFTSGEQTYDFIYISDAVRAMILTAEQGQNSQEYYIGSRSQRKLKEYIVCMRDLVAPDAMLQLGAIPYEGPFLDYREIDIEKLYKQLGFQMEYSFEEGIRLTKDWMEKG